MMIRRRTILDAACRMRSMPGYAGLALLVLAGAFLSIPAWADTGYSQSVGGYSVYLGVVPAEIIKGHPAQHAEASMHGGTRTGGSHHVMISIIDDKTSKQVTDAAVEAQVGEIGLSVTTRKMEPMVIVGTTTYGNFFPMNGNGPFQIDVEFRPAGRAQALNTRFYYTHPGFKVPR